MNKIILMCYFSTIKIPLQGHKNAGGWTTDIELFGPKSYFEVYDVYFQILIV